MIKKVKKRDGTVQEYQVEKIKTALLKALNEVNEPQWKTQCFDIDDLVKEIQCEIEDKANKLQPTIEIDTVGIEFIQDCVEDVLMDFNLKKTAKAYILYRQEHKKIRELAQSKLDFVKNYMKSDNTANATVDDNSNVKGKNVGIMNAEIHKQENINTNRYMVMKKLNELYPDFDAKQYVRDLEEGIIYKHDESSSNTGATMPYCCSISLYPFLNDGLKNIGGLSAAPKNLDSFCGMYCNLIFCIAGQFLGAVATSEFLTFFDYFARKEWGDSYYKNPDLIITQNCERVKTIRSQIHQYFQQVTYTINQSAANRGMQSAFTNFSYFDKDFFEGMFGTFYFPDDTKPIWESVQWLQEEYMHWFNQERLKTMLTFPVESTTLLYKDGKFTDERMLDFVAEEYAEGHSMFTYISDSVDSLSSCCRLKNKIQTKEFNFTNGNMGVNLFRPLCA
jgi:ribonucleoside-triphosphate reductase